MYTSQISVASTAHFETGIAPPLAHDRMKGVTSCRGHSNSWVPRIFGTNISIRVSKENSLGGVFDQLRAFDQAWCTLQPEPPNVSLFPLHHPENPTCLVYYLFEPIAVAIASNVVASFNSTVGITRYCIHGSAGFTPFFPVSKLVLVSGWMLKSAVWAWLLP